MENKENYNGSGGGEALSNTIKWENNRKLLIIKDGCWIDASKLRFLLLNIRKMNLTVLENRTTALKMINDISVPLDTFYINCYMRFGDALELVCEEIGLWQREFLHLRTALTTNDYKYTPYYNAEWSNSDSLEIEYDYNDVYPLLNIITEMLTHLIHGSEVFTRDRFEQKFQLQWF